MLHKNPQLIIKFSLILFCVLFVGITRIEEPASCQSCVVGFWEPPPKDSWLQNEQVAVRIDDSWNSTERGFFEQGIRKWNGALNCSNVTFHDFSSIHFENFNNAPPDFTLWWQKDLRWEYFISFYLPSQSKDLERSSFLFRRISRMLLVFRNA